MDRLAAVGVRLTAIACQVEAQDQPMPRLCIRRCGVQKIRNVKNVAEAVADLASSLHHHSLALPWRIRRQTAQRMWLEASGAQKQYSGELTLVPREAAESRVDV